MTKPPTLMAETDAICGIERENAPAEEEIASGDESSPDLSSVRRPAKRARRTLLFSPRSSQEKAEWQAQFSPDPTPAPAFASRTAEAEVHLTRAKRLLGGSRNLKTEIKYGVIEELEALFRLVEAGDAAGERGGPDPEPTPTPTRKISNDAAAVIALTAKVEEQAGQLRENTEVLGEIRQMLIGVSLVPPSTQQAENTRSYADAVARPSGARPAERGTLLSLVVTSEDVIDTGEQVLDKIREAVDAKEGWVRVERVRKAKNQKVILSMESEAEREKVRNRLKDSGKRLVVEDMKNRDPLLILRSVRAQNSDADILKALRKQNPDIFGGLDSEDRIVIKFRKRTRNPHSSHVVVSTAPAAWRRAVDVGTLRVDLQQIVVADYSPLVQCSRCLGYGHSKRYCTEEKEVCSHCGGPHRKSECSDWKAGSAPSCSNCVKASCPQTGHNAFSSECNIRRRYKPQSITVARIPVILCKVKSDGKGASKRQITYKPYVKPAAMDHDYKNIGLKRPMSPHLTIYAPTLPAVTSISQRISGAIATFYALVLSGSALFLSNGVDSLVSAIQSLKLGGLTILLLKIILGLPFSFHYFNGIRFVGFNLAKWMTKKEVYASAQKAIIAAGVLTLLFAVL